MQFQCLYIGCEKIDVIESLDLNILGNMARKTTNQIVHETEWRGPAPTMDFCTPRFLEAPWPVDSKFE